MRVLLIGDIHGNLEALDACLCTINKEQIDRVNVLGDIVGYMANPNECVDIVKSMDCISGNHDTAVFDDMELMKFNPFAYSALLWTRRCLNSENTAFLKGLPSYRIYCDEGYTIAHGSIIDPFMYLEYESQVRLNARFMSTKLLFVGHTHIPMIWYIHGKKENLIHSYRRIEILPIDYNVDITLHRDKMYIINIGSVGQPRDSNPKGCCVIYDSDNYSIKYIRFEYPVESTIEKIKASNLPDFLHLRLLNGE